MQWSARVSNGCSVLKVSGPINRVDASRLKILLNPKGMSTAPVVDFSEVTFLGPAGLEALACAASPLAEHPWPLAVVVGNRSAQVVQAIEDADLQQTLRLFDSVEHAIAAGPTECAMTTPIQPASPQRAVRSAPNKPVRSWQSTYSNHCSSGVATNTWW
jgi:anti-anti-sigma regulatory factor